jgi:hypothetical protein
MAQMNINISDLIVFDHLLVIHYHSYIYYDTPIFLKYYSTSELYTYSLFSLHFITLKRKCHLLSPEALQAGFKKSIKCRFTRFLNPLGNAIFAEINL